jgi:hypothetical protein
MYFLFPFLFKKKRSSHLPGLQQLLSKINEMGLGDYINNFQNFNKSSFSTRNVEMNDEIERNEKWWYLGP